MKLIVCTVHFSTKRSSRCLVPSHRYHMHVCNVGSDAWLTPCIITDRYLWDRLHQRVLCTDCTAGLAETLAIL